MLTAKKLVTLFTLLAFLVLPAGVLTAPAVARASLAESSASLLADLIFRHLDIGVTVYDIDDLRTTRNMGNGEIALAYSLAHSSGYPVGYILHLRFDEKMGWGKIAKTLGVKLRDAADKSDFILREGNLHRNADEFKAHIRIDLDDEDDSNPGNKPDKALHDNGKPDKPAQDSDKPGKGRGKNK